MVPPVNKAEPLAYRRDEQVLRVRFERAQAKIILVSCERCERGPMTYSLCRGIANLSDRTVGGSCYRYEIELNAKGLALAKERA